MARDEVRCTVEETDVETERGTYTPGVEVTCGDCGDTATAMGTGDSSVTRALCQLRENCSMGRRNFYVADR